MTSGDPIPDILFGKCVGVVEWSITAVRSQFWGYPRNIIDVISSIAKRWLAMQEAFSEFKSIPKSSLTLVFL